MRRRQQAAPTLSIADPRFLSIVEAAPAREKLWRRVINVQKPRVCVEVGVWKGAFAAAVLKGCPSIRTYYMVDPWARLPDWNKPFNVSTEEFADVYNEAMRVTDFARARREVLRGTTSSVASSIRDASVDFAYVDGDHTLRGITIDLARILPKMRHGGLLCGDDFVSRRQHGAEYEPTLVFPYAIYFAEAHGLPIVGLKHRQFAIENSPERGFSFSDLSGGDFQDISGGVLSVVGEPSKTCP